MEISYINQKGFTFIPKTQLVITFIVLNAKSVKEEEEKHFDIDSEGNGILDKTVLISWVIPG